MHISLIDIVISIALKSVKYHWFWFREQVIDLQDNFMLNACTTKGNSKNYVRMKQHRSNIFTFYNTSNRNKSWY